MGEIPNWRWFGFARYHRLPSVSCTDCDWYRRVGGAGEICAMHEWLCTLAHNLAVAAGHCLSYELGANPPDTEPAKRIRLRTGIAVIPAAVWRPGCGREAPGWRDE